MTTEARAYPRPLPNPEWLGKLSEEILEPDLPIVDPHHHMWERPGNRYLFQDLLADTGSGHNVVATCFEECREMYRADGPQELKSLGETEFVNGIAAMSASGKYGKTRCIAGIIGNVDLRIGSRAKGILEEHVTISGGRFKGIRNGATWHDDPSLQIYCSGALKACTATAASARGLLASPRSASASMHGCSIPSWATWPIWRAPSRKRR